MTKDQIKNCISDIGSSKSDEHDRQSDPELPVTVVLVPENERGEHVRNRIPDKCLHAGPTRSVASTAPSSISRMDDMTVWNTPIFHPGPGGKLIMISDYLPDFDTSPSTRRFFHLLEILTSAGFETLCLHSTRTPRDGICMRALQRGTSQGSITFACHIRDEVGYLRCIQEFSPETVWFTDLWTTDSLDFAGRLTGRIKETLPGTRIILDIMDFRSKKFQRRYQQTGAPEALRTAKAFFALEHAVLPRADHVVVVSREEKEDIERSIPGCAPVSVIPHISRFPEVTASFEAGQGLVFIGNYEVDHNVDAAHWMVREVMPKIRAKCPDITLHLVGPGAGRPAGIASDTVIAADFDEDLDLVLPRYRAMVCPMTNGDDRNGMIDSATSRGLPVVSTTIGIESYPFRDGRECLVADDPDSFAEQCIRIHTDPELWRKLSRGAREMLAEQCSIRTVSEQLSFLFPAREAAGSDCVRAEEGTERHGRLLHLAEHYRKRGNREKYELYMRLAGQVPEAETPQQEAGSRDKTFEAACLLYAKGSDDAVLRVVGSRPADGRLASMVSSIFLRRGEADAALKAIRVLPDKEERLLKAETLALLQDPAPALDPEPRVHILLLSYNRRQYLPEALRQLAGTAYSNYALYIADNHSTDGSWEILPDLLKFFPDGIEIKTERLPTNIGRPAGHNWLLENYDHRKADYIAIADDDLVRVPPSWLTEMVRTAKRFPHAAVVGGKALTPGPLKIIHGGVRRFITFENLRLELTNENDMLDCGQFDYIDRVDHVIGCLHIYDRKFLMNDIGLFDIRFSPCQMVDIEHHLRTRLKGYDIIYNGLIEFEHLRAMGKQASSERATIGNSIGNVVKLLHKYIPSEVQQFIAKQAELRAKRLEEAT